MFVLRGSDVAQLACHLHVSGVFWKTHGDIVGLEVHRGADIVHVLGGQCGSRQATALFVDAFVVRQLAANTHGGVDCFAAHRFNSQHDQAVIEQQDIAGFDIARQFFVIQTHTGQVTQLGT